jgi:Rod binding domain-containing protein
MKTHKGFQGLEVLKKRQRKAVEIHRPNIQNHKSSEDNKRLRTKGDDLQYVPKDFKKVAGGLEQQFVQYMLQQMNKSIGKGSSEGSAMDYYKDLQNTEQAKTLTNHNNGLGIQELILNQIYPKKFRNPQAMAAFTKDQESRLIRKNKIEMEGPKEPINSIKKAQDIEMHHGPEANHE